MAEKLKSIEQRQNYVKKGVEAINGMLQSGSLSILWSLMELQDHFDVKGNIAEIGVFQGKLLLLLCHWLNRGETAYGIDVYGTPPGRNQADIDSFLENLKYFGFADSDCKLIVKDSFYLSAQDICDLAGGQTIRLFSVDGDHSKEGVLHDLTIATASLCDGGVIIADDLFNAWYPTVTEAVYEYFRTEAAEEMEPIAFIAANGPVETGAAKLLIARQGYATKYKAGLKILNQDDLKHCDPFAGHKEVPTFWFASEPKKRTLDDYLVKILDDIFEDG